MNLETCPHCGAGLVPELMTCPRCGEPAEHPIPTDLRCECGFLLCKLTEDALEIKCRRCRRLIQLPLDDLPGVYQRRKDAPPRPAYKPRRESDPEVSGQSRPGRPPYRADRDQRNNRDSRGPRDNREKRDNRDEPRGQICQSCGQYKPSVLYGKCIQCRTETIKVQYKSKHR